MKRFYNMVCVWMILSSSWWVGAMESDIDMQVSHRIVKIHVDGARLRLQTKCFDQLIDQTTLLNDVAAARDGTDVLQAVRYAFCQHTKHDAIAGAAVALREAELLEILLDEYPEVYEALVHKGLVRQPIQ